MNEGMNEWMEERKYTGWTEMLLSAQHYYYLMLWKQKKHNSFQFVNAVSSQFLILFSSSFNIICLQSIFLHNSGLSKNVNHMLSYFCFKIL